VISSLVKLDKLGIYLFTQLSKAAASRRDYSLGLQSLNSLIKTV